VSETSAPFYGNADTVARIERKIAEGRLGHALIFSGPEGIGKRTWALRVAQALNCNATDSPTGCGTCRSCQRVVSLTHPDVQYLTLEDDASQIKIEQIRALRSQLELEALEGAARVYIIDPAERMTPGAANALLKALEEPPPGTHFLLVTANVHELLVTIRSRCHVYHFTPLSLAQVRAAGIDDELVVRWSQGSIGRALATDPEGLRSLRDELLDFLSVASTAPAGQLAVLPGAAADLARSKEDFAGKVRALGVLVSDLLYLRTGLDARLVNIDREADLRRIADRIGLDRVVELGDTLRFIETSLKRYVNRQMLADALVLAANPETARLTGRV
jgi:DNA polymerase-3 subunit delta'